MIRVQPWLRLGRRINWRHWPVAYFLNHEQKHIRSLVGKELVRCLRVAAESGAENQSQEKGRRRYGTYSQDTDADWRDSTLPVATRLRAAMAAMASSTGRLQIDGEAVLPVTVDRIGTQALSFSQLHGDNPDRVDVHPQDRVAREVRWHIDGPISAPIGALVTIATTLAVPDGMSVVPLQACRIEGPLVTVATTDGPLVVPGGASTGR